MYNPVSVRAWRSVRAIIFPLMAGLACSVAGAGEAPEFAAKVAAGELPALPDRLPEQPLVMTPIERVGVYGGTWRAALKGGADHVHLIRTIGYDGLVSWNPDWSAAIPGLATQWQANADATEYTFTLRKGAKWSDGTPFTSEDVRFAIEDMEGNSEFYPSPFRWLTANDELVKVTVIDDATFKLTYAAPNGFLIQRLATGEGVDLVNYPAHYCKQFHPKYNANANAEAKAAGFQSWGERMKVMCDRANEIGRWQNPDKPTMMAFMSVEPYLGDSKQLNFVRNPYYWKVDTAGNQLPYLDGVQFTVAESAEDIVFRALNGEIDLQDRHISSLSLKPVFYDGQEKGHFHFYDLLPSQSNAQVIALNLNHPDPTKRALFQNKDFRIALSEAINRPEINDAIYLSQTKPYQVGPRPESEFYNEQLATQYTRFDPDKANQLLDRVGLKQRNKDGIRLMENGKPVQISVDVVAAIFPFWIDTLELVQKYWRDVGIDLKINTVDRTIFYETRRANQHDAQVWAGDAGAGVDVMLDPRWLFPYSDESIFAIRWQAWFNDPTQPLAEEPPAQVKQQMALYRQLTQIADPKQQAELMHRIVDMAADEFYVMGIVLSPNLFGIQSDRLHNVPNAMPAAWNYPNPAPVGVAQFFMQ
ncbi:ABC transporter substrate-binding protein [Gynuella sunshinyii]|uniref:ABC-type dipeptide transport system, periplasmic component n=1 Tax=Gynuella sunshinyii YC6258 TaxID=1445510 RepID=A0A0C5W5U5_9GAMM|nr:ABC transporter substrate-binding protein [Gynuella sunshinyii]AJQ97974.1 ABC-type dipeptide transport system, periplasmic component [Gynuella sunshinyii YC6258]